MTQLELLHEGRGVELLRPRRLGTPGIDGGGRRHRDSAQRQERQQRNDGNTCEHIVQSDVERGVERGGELFGRMVRDSRGEREGGTAAQRNKHAQQ